MQEAVAEMEKGFSEKIVFSFSTFRGKNYADIRVYYEEDEGEEENEEGQADRTLCCDEGPVTTYHGLTSTSTPLPDPPWPAPPRAPGGRAGRGARAWRVRGRATYLHNV